MRNSDRDDRVREWLKERTDHVVGGWTSSQEALSDFNSWNRRTWISPWNFTEALRRLGHPFELREHGYVYLDFELTWFEPAGEGEGDDQSS